MSDRATYGVNACKKLIRPLSLPIDIQKKNIQFYNFFFLNYLNELIENKHQIHANM